jgi:hypothetical protein
LAQTVQLLPKTRLTLPMNLVVMTLLFYSCNNYHVCHCFSVHIIYG